MILLVVWLQTPLCWNLKIHVDSLLRWFDREKEAQFVPAEQKLRRVGSVMNGVITLWTALLIGTGITFLVMFSGSYQLCSVPYVPPYSAVAVSPFQSVNAAAVPDNSYCPPQEDANIGRESAMRPFSAPTEDVKLVLDYMRTSIAGNVTVDLLGFSNWLGDCNYTCANGLQLVSSGCRTTAGTACASAMTPVCQVQKTPL